MRYRVSPPIAAISFAEGGAFAADDDGLFEISSPEAARAFAEHGYRLELVQPAEPAPAPVPAATDAPKAARKGRAAEAVG